MEYSLIDFKILGDERGYLIALEGEESIPFKIKSINYIYETGASTIKKLPLKKDMEQVAICVSGSCRFILTTSDEQKVLCLASPSQALYVKGSIDCAVADFSKDCVVMVLANQKW